MTGAARLALRLAWRELRGGARGLRIVLACLALGVAAIAGVGSLRAGVEAGLAAQGRALLGGDLEIQGGAQPLPDALRDWLRARGARISDVLTMRSILVAPNGERALILLKAVDPAYPLVGRVRLDPAQPLGRALAGGGLAVERVVADRLRVRPGAVLRLGDAHLPLRAILTQEPDGVAGLESLGARAMIALGTLPATGLVQPGSMVRHALRAVLPPGTDRAALERALRAAFPDTGWRLRGPRDALPGARQLIDQAGLFMTLVGLTALLVGGIGVATGVRAWLEARARSIATLRCLGASARLIFGVYLAQILALSAVGVLAGLAVGALLPVLAAWALAGVLPVPPRLGLYGGPLGLAAGYGLLTATCFALGPLGRAAGIPGAALFRDAVLPERMAGPGRRRLLGATWVFAAALVGLTVATAPQRGFALWFCAAAIVALLAFRAGGAVLVAGAARLHGARLGIGPRLGLAALHRPGSAAPLMLVSLGVGLSTLASVALIEANLRRVVAERMPRDAPSFFFIDIQPVQLPDFLRLVRGLPGVTAVRHVPNLRARIVAVNGVPADQVKATPGTRWALRGDRGLTWAATPPPDTHLVAGHWWAPDYRGAPLVSFDAGLARGWGVGVGGTIRVNVLGRDIDLKVASLRDIPWRDIGLHFALVASPGMLEHAPHTSVATLRAPPGKRGAVLRAVTDRLPNVTGIDVADVLAEVARLLSGIAAALGATGGLTLGAGALVLAGTVAAGQRRRIREAVVLKTLGATRAQIRAAWLMEFGVIGVASGLVAAGVGTAASWAVMRFLMHAPWRFMPGVLAATVLACVALMLGFGYIGTASALRAPASPWLRNE